MHLAALQAFYAQPRFRVMGGDAAQNWLTLRNGSTTLSPFHGMFERKMQLSTASWNATCNTLPAFTDVREQQRQLCAKGLTPTPAVDDTHRHV